MNDHVKGSRLQLRRISKLFGGAYALDDVDLDVEAGEFVSILGPSGSGKSTLLRVIAGLEAAKGEVLIGGVAVTGLPPKTRGVAFMFQSYALYPHMTVGQNIAAPLVMQTLRGIHRLPLIRRFMPGARALRARIDERVRRTASLLQIEPFLGRRPAELSGGQRQRVALARALIRKPKLFLLDEPLANLDAALRHRTRTELRSLQRQLGTTTLFVTHDQSEAMAISDRIAVMFDGRIRQIGTPDELYRRPVDIDVARFLTQPVLNVLPAERVGARTIRVEERLLAMSGPASGHGTVAFRPEGATLDDGVLDAHDLPVLVDAVEHAGADAHIHVRVSPSHMPVVVRVPSTEIGRWHPGQTARLAIDPRSAWFFPGTTADPALSPTFAREEFA